MAGLFGSGSASAANTLGDLSKDIQLNNGPEDSISHISFSPQSDHLAVASWDKKVRIYEVNAQGGGEVTLGLSWGFWEGRGFRRE